MAAIRRWKMPKEHEIVIVPSLLSADFANLERVLKKIERAGCKWIHLDVMDGHFAPNITFGPPLIKSLRAVSKKLIFDTHLMVEYPALFIEAFANAGSDIITVHVESKSKVSRILTHLDRLGVKKGISISPSTPIEAAEPFLRNVDNVLVMTVKPGFGGQSLIPSTLTKVRNLKLLRDKKKYKYSIQVDGGINKETAPMAFSAGANILVAGSSVLGDGRIATNVKSIINIVKSSLQ